MHDENFDSLDDIFGTEKEEIEESSKKEKSNKLVGKSETDKQLKKSKKKKDSFGYKAKSIVLKSVLPAVGTGVICFVLGGLIFSKGDDVSQKVQQAQTIKSSSTVLENVNSVKDLQIETLKKQLANLTTMDKEGNQILSTNGQNANHLAFTRDVNAAASGAVDEFFSKLIAVNPTANESEIQAIQPDLAKYMTSSSATSELYSTLTGGSAAKELGKKTTKISSATVTLARSDDDNQRTYLVSVPISTPSDEQFYNAFYIVQMNKDYKIEFARYVGYSGGPYALKLNELYKTTKDKDSKDKNKDSKDSKDKDKAKDSTSSESKLKISTASKSNS